MNPFDSAPARRSSPHSTRHAARGTAASASASVGEPEKLLACDEVEGDIVAYFDGEATDQCALRARRHLDACAECARMWRDWGDSRLLLRSARLPAMPVHWPATLVQRARLQALLPALFGPSPASSAIAAGAPAGELKADFQQALQAPRELRDAILARTTRAIVAPHDLEPAATPAAAKSPTEAATQAAMLGPDICIEPRPERAARERRYPLATRACLPALAAWMLVLAWTPARRFQGLEQNLRLESAPSRDARALLRKALLKGGAHASPVGAARATLKLANRAWASTQASTQQAAAHIRALALAQVARADDLAPASSPPPAPLPAALDARPEPLQPLGLSPALDTEARQELAPSISQAPGSQSAWPRRLAPPQPSPPRETPVQALASRGSLSARNPVGASASTSHSSQPAAPIAHHDQEAARVADASASTAVWSVEVEAEASPQGEDAWGDEASGEHESREPLAAASEMNDVRPADVGDAIDAYAATYEDESDAL